MAAVQGKNQFWIRCQYAKGLLGMEYAKGLKGPDLVTATLEAIQHLIRGLEVAVTVPRYTFLIYNCSVHYWQVLRTARHTCWVRPTRRS